MKKILIADDDAELRSHLSEILKGAGYHAEEASTGQEAMDKAAAGAFDVILLDMLMPKGDGLEVLGYLKKFSPHSRVIMLTAFATVEDAVEAVKRGASHYLKKPFKKNDLLTVIRRVLEEASFRECSGQRDLEGILSSLSNPTRTRIMRMLAARGKMRLREITKELQIEDHTKVVFHLRTLKQSDLVEQDKEKQYSLTEEGVKTLSCLKILETHIQHPPRTS
jgi:DNA-binding NtrC family response regulator